MNPLSNKFLGLFVILVVMLATLTASSPIPELDKRTPVLHVSAPGPGRRAIKSIQNVSWWCNECGSKDKVIIKVKDARGTFVTLTGHNANSGTKDFVIDPSWARPGFTYFVQVFLKKNPSISGVSSSFEVFATEG